MEKLEDLISIVIPCYNDGLHVGEAVESALNQTYKKKEIILVDDGSNRETKEVLSQIESKIDLLITQDNKGPSSARNRGIESAKGKYILVLDSDDYFEPVFCEKAIGIMGNNPDVKLVTCQARWFWNDKDFQIYNPRGGTVKDFLNSNAAVGNSLFRKNDFERIGGYDLDLVNGYEDWEFFIHLLKNGGSAYVIPEILFHYRKRKGSRSYTANSRKYELMEYIYLKHEDVYKKYFSFFIREWLLSNKKSEAFKQQVMDSPDYKVGHKFLKPFRSIGLFKRKLKNDD